MRRLASFVPLLLLAAGLPLVPAQRPDTLSAGVFAIRDARVVLAPGKILDKATLVIRDGLVEAVGPDVTPPVDAIVVEGKGLTAYPGFVDAATNLGHDAAQRKSAVGEGAAPDPAENVLAASDPGNRRGITPDFQVRSALDDKAEASDGWRRVGVTARLVAPAGGVVAGQSALVSLSGAAAREAVLLSPAAQHVSFRSPAGAGYPRSLMGTVAHARQFFLDAQRHQKSLAAFAASGGAGKRPPADPGLEAMASALARKTPVILEADSRDEIHRALDFAAEFGLRPILLGGEDADLAVDRLVAEKVPVLFRLDLSDESSPLVVAAERTAPARVKKDRKGRRDRQAACPAVLHAKGVPFAFASQGIGGDKPADTFQKNLRKVIAAGLPAEAALAALTTSPAKILAAEGQLGTIAKNRAAHVVLADGDFEKPTTKIRQVFVDGKRFRLDVPPAVASNTPRRKGKDKAENDDPDKAPKKGKRNRPKGDDPKEDTPKKDAPKEDDKPDPGVRNEFDSEIDADRKPATRTGGDVLLKNATVLPVSGDAMPKADILVRKGKIVAVGKDVEAPEGVKVIDLEGFFVMPGIIDTHCHFAISGGVNEMSLSVVPEVRVKDVINSDDVQIYRALAGGVTTARLLHGSANVIGGQDAVIKLRRGKAAKELLVAGAPRGVKFALGENVKRTDGRFPNTRMGVEAGLVRAFTEAKEYRQLWDDSKGTGTGVTPRRDLRLEALADVLSGDLKIHCHCYRADEILMLLRVADRFGVKVRSLQHVLEGYKVAPEIAKHGASCSPFSDWWAYKWEAADAIPQCASLLQRAGVSVCLKSDSNELMRHMYQEAAKIVKYGGMGEREALALITLNGARQLGIDKRTGSIEVGKDADLAVFNGHPLNSYARVEMTLVDGEVYFERKDRKPSAIASAPPAKPLAATPTLPDASKGDATFFDAVVHPVSAATIDKGTVVVRKGRIAAVRPTTDEDRAAAGAFDAKGLHVYPGMIDAASILGLVEVDSARETRDYAEAGEFQPDLRAGTAVNPDSELIPVTRANGVLSVVTRPTGGVIAGQSALLNLAGWTPGEMTLRDPLALHVELPGGVPGIGRGSPFGMASRAINRRVRDDRLRKLRDLFRQSLTHDRARREKKDTPGNPRLEALVPYANGSRPVVIQASRLEEIREAMKLADELKLKVIIAGGVDAWKVAAELKKRDIPVILGPVLTLPYEGYDPYDAPFTCAAKLHAAGVRFCIRSNGDSNTRNLPYHAAMAVSYGLAPDAGLRSVTLDAAKLLGVEADLGSIEEGKLANLVFANGDILQASTQIAGLTIAGRPFAPTSKHTRLHDRYSKRLEEVERKR